MTTEKTERKMGPRGLLHKANSSKVSAIAFIAAHREYLVNGEVGYVTAPIVAKVDAGELFPTPALDEIKRAVMGHIMLLDMLAAKDKEESAQDGSPKAGKTKKPYTACIRDGSGAVVMGDDGKPMKQSFDVYQRAFDWCDRRLFESAPDCFGEVTSNKCQNPDHATDLVTRNESLARILKRPMGAVCKGQKHSGTLGFGVKAKNDVSHFSHG